MTNGSSSRGAGGMPKGAIGIDLSDKTATYVEVDEASNVCAEGKISLTEASLRKKFGQHTPMRIAIEAGTHSPWVERVLRKLGHEVVVANPRQVKLISRSKRKNDRQDAELLARLANADPALLKPIRHRGAQAQADLALLRARDGLVRARAMLVNLVRGQVKSQGGRIPSCSTEAFASKAEPFIQEELRPALVPILSLIKQHTRSIKAIEDRLKKAAERYPEVALLRRVKGVGLVTALAFVLVIEDPQHFERSRAVGAYLGLTAAQSQSGQSEPQLHITKAGDELLRRLLVQSAHYILGRFGEDSDLRRWGQKLAGDGGNKIRKRKAVVAVARKLAVLMHRLWVNGLVYEPLYRQAAVSAAA